MRKGTAAKPTKIYICDDIFPTKTVVTYILMNYLLASFQLNKLNVYFSGLKIHKENIFGASPIHLDKYSPNLETKQFSKRKRHESGNKIKQLK